MTRSFNVSIQRAAKYACIFHEQNSTLCCRHEARRVRDKHTRSALVACARALTHTGARALLSAAIRRARLRPPQPALLPGPHAIALHSVSAAPRA